MWIRHTGDNVMSTMWLQFWTRKTDLGRTEVFILCRSFLWLHRVQAGPKPNQDFNPLPALQEKQHKHITKNALREPFFYFHILDGHLQRPLFSKGFSTASLSPIVIPDTPLLFEDLISNIPPKKKTLFWANPCPKNRNNAFVKPRLSVFPRGKAALCYHATPPSSSFWASAIKLKLVLFSGECARLQGGEHMRNANQDHAVLQRFCPNASVQVHVCCHPVSQLFHETHWHVLAPMTAHC